MTASPKGTGVLGTSKSHVGVNVAVDGTAASPGGFGVRGHNTAPGGLAISVKGIIDSTDGSAVSPRWATSPAATWLTISASADAFTIHVSKAVTGTLKVAWLLLG